MKHWQILILILMAFALCINAYFFKDKPCGGNERWDVKIMADKEELKVHLRPMKASIKDLSDILFADKWSDSLPRKGAEFNTYTLKCGIREYRIEEDKDIHLVLYDLTDTNQTMIGEIPNLQCPKYKDFKYKKFYDTCLIHFSKYRLPNNKVEKGEYQISGVLFRDKIHGQLGVNKNGTEIHPIFLFRKLK